MMYELSVQEEVIQTSHHWPVIFIFCIAGIVVGWGISIFWPSNYRASKDIYVGINPYRALEDQNAAEHAEVEFINPDDYKNWQMANLNNIILMDWLVQKTLKELQVKDDYWISFSEEELGRMLKVNWRNAGKWRLVAESADQRRAAQAVSAWHAVAIEELKTATLQAQNALLFHTQLQEIASRQIAMETKISELTQFQDSLLAWKQEYTNPSDGQSLDDNARQELEILLNNAGSDNQWLIQFIPIIPHSSSAAEYQDWVQQVVTATGTEIQSLDFQLAHLNKQQGDLFARYAQASNNSYGLSSNLVVEDIRERSIELYAVRPMGLIILAGGAIGLLLWTALWLIKVTL
jgi:hypothetical protein